MSIAQPYVVMNSKAACCFAFLRCCMPFNAVFDLWGIDLVDMLPASLSEYKYLNVSITSEAALGFSEMHRVYVLVLLLSPFQP